MLTILKPRLEKLMNPLTDIFKDVNPNWLTLFAIIPAVVFFWALQQNAYLLAGIAFLGLSVDALDGAVARKFKKVSIFGGVLDSTLDRAVDCLLIWAFVSADLISQELGIVAVTLAFLTSYIRSRGGLSLGSDKSLSVGVVERTERMLLIGLATVVAYFFPTNLFMSHTLTQWVFITLVVLSAVTVLQRIHKVHQLS
jgi:CDP-diacylglycerol---glycerol-3-phosphate 3-phosphatidyltransferase